MGGDDMLAASSAHSGEWTSQACRDQLTQD